MEAKELGKWIQGATAMELAGILAMVGARLVALASPPLGAPTIAGPARLVTIAKAAEATGMSRRWFYDRPEAPWMRRLGPRTYRVDLTALEASLAGTRP